jgi:sugar lactone lactonase YvrE
VFKVPESVLFDAGSNLLYVSNIDGREPWGKDGKGSIGRMRPDGSVLQVEWVQGLNAPKGMALHKQQLVVADIQELVWIDVRKASIVRKLAIENAIALNDVTMDERGTVYVTDSRGRKVYRVANNQATVLLDSNQLRGPNGIKWIKGRLYVLDAGALLRYNPDGTITRLAEGMEGGTDGLEQVNATTFLVSCWSGVMYLVQTNGAKQLLLDTRPQKMNTADIGWDARKRIVYIPTFWKNTVAAYQLQ